MHTLPDFVYFNHAVHVHTGIQCTNCHGNVQDMARVYRKSPLTMQWCLECHREPEKFLRPREELTNLAWKATDHPLAKEKGVTDPAQAQQLVGNAMKEQFHIRPAAYMTSCSTCHR